MVGLLAGEGDEHLMLAVGAANSGKAFLQIAALEKGRHRLFDDRPPVAILCRRTGACFPGRNCQRASRLRRRGVCPAASASVENLSVRTAGRRTQIKPKPAPAIEKRTRLAQVAPTEGRI
jgi:hypothetical protein